VRPFAGTPVPSAAPGCLHHLEEAPANRLLQARGVVLRGDSDIGAIPEARELRPLTLQQRVEAIVDRPIERPDAAVDQLGSRRGGRRLIGDVLDDPDGHARLRVDREHHLAHILAGAARRRLLRGRLDDMLDADPERHPAVGGGIPEQETLSLRGRDARLQDAVWQRRGEPGIREGLAVSRESWRILSVGDLRRDDDGRGVVEQGHLVRDRREMAMLE
jgi:hypothetical protein